MLKREKKIGAKLIEKLLFGITAVSSAIRQTKKPEKIGKNRRRWPLMHSEK
jgi:hypothetical protein